MKNVALRNSVKRNKLKLWQVAEAAGISPFTLSVWLRDELTGDRKKRIDEALCTLISKGGGGTNGSNTDAAIKNG